MSIDDLWYKNAVIYCLDVEKYMDANGDGVGDFEGLSRRLEYLAGLGVTCVWLQPFYNSPNRDNGYDVSDYFTVDARHGDGGDFVEFMHHAEKRGIKVLMDLVVNHTSDEHPWFQEARDPDSDKHDWYVWADERPEDWNDGMVFPGHQETTWTYDRKAKRYYFHRFYDFQPDLNMDNPRVRVEIQRIIGFWLQLGVKGFRVDALPFMIERVDPAKGDGEHRFDYLTEFRSFLQWRSGDAILLGEANVLPDENRKYFGDERGDRVHMMFNFFVNQHLFYALATGDVETLKDAIRATADVPETGQWAHFLRNHDELDLGRLTDEQRQRVFERFGPEEHMQLYGRGIRRRLAPMLGDRRHEELAYSMMFALPGTPVIRYGDELGMGDNLELEQRKAVRTPMQWDNAPNAGFSTADDLIHPVIDEGVWSYEHVNVASQRRDPHSLLNWTARMIRLRKECPEIGWGKCTVLEAESPHVLALRYDWRGNSILVIHNFAERPEEIRIDPDVDGGESLSNLISEEELFSDDGTHKIPLDAHDYRWYRIGGLDYAINRKET